MTYEEFKDTVKSEILGFLPEKYADADVSIEQVVKNNDTKLDGLLIRTSETNIAPNIYLNSFYSDYTRDMISLDEIMQKIADVYLSHTSERDFDVSMITNLDRVRDHVVCKLINADMNKDYLEDKPHTYVADLAVVYAVDLGGDSERGRMSAPVTYRLLEHYGISQDELHDLALKNLAASELSFKGMSQVMREMMGGNGLPEFMLPPVGDGPEMMNVLTNKEKLNGAAAILDDKTMQDIATKMGGDFIVIPSSIHEVIIVPLSDEMSRDDIEGMIREVNEGQVVPEERLSDHAYVYDAAGRNIMSYEKYETSEKLNENIFEPVNTEPVNEESQKADNVMHFTPAHAGGRR